MPKNPLEKRLKSHEKKEKCGQEDSNLHAVKHQILSLACLPIPPCPQVWQPPYTDLKEVNYRCPFPRSQVVVHQAIGQSVEPHSFGSDS